MRIADFKEVFNFETFKPPKPIFASDISPGIGLKN